MWVTCGDGALSLCWVPYCSLYLPWMGCPIFFVRFLWPRRLDTIQLMSSCWKTMLMHVFCVCVFFRTSWHAADFLSCVLDWFLPFSLLFCVTPFLCPFLSPSVSDSSVAVLWFSHFFLLTRSNGSFKSLFYPKRCLQSACPVHAAKFNITCRWSAASSSHSPLWRADP